MDLSAARIGPAAVEEICALQDDCYRNHWITYAYSDLSVRLAAITGGNANWFTFGRWSSYTVGENLRTDKPSLGFAQLVQSSPLMRLFSDPLTRLQRNLRMLSDAAMPRALALGNQLVFHEIAYVIARFLEWHEHQPITFEAFVGSIEAMPASDMYCPGDVSWLREGVDCYYRATREQNAKQQAELVLRGNLRLAQYEQWRLQPVIQIALDPVAKHLVEFVDSNPHEPREAQVILKRRGTQWAFRHRSAFIQWATEHYEEFMTTHVFAWEGPIRGPLAPLYLGRGLADNPGGRPLYPWPLDHIDDLDTATLVREFDRSNGTYKGRGARNWTRFAERMNFVVSLFRAEQQDQGLFQPVSKRELRILDLDLSDAHLDRLRQVGDAEIDAYVENYCQNNEHDARSLVHEMVKHGMYSYDDLRERATLPSWANPETLQRGQDFLREHGLEIASALFCGSLPFSYTAADGARVLTRTAELTTGHTTRRLAETGQMLLDLMAGDEPPLAPGSLGSNAVRGVRLFHAAVRHMIGNDQQPWPTATAGVPINQEDLVGTLVVFTVVVLDALDEMGVVSNSPETEADRDAYLHFWLAVGHLLGIDYAGLRRGDELGPEEQPLTLEELRLTGEAIFRRHAASSAGGQVLMASLLEAMRRQMFPLMRGYPAALTRRLIGNRNADLLGVPPAGPTRWLFDVLRPVARAVAPRAHGRVFRCFARWTTRRLYQDWINNQPEARPPWRIEPVAKAWGLHPRKSNGNGSGNSGDVDIVTGAQQSERAARGGSGTDGVDERRGAPRSPASSDD
ncbi:MAG: hypothetical protein JWL83_4668 [Actinomycetia bacterium]|nr:hypothetical protein [Actinomycetes bacterium]